MARKKVSIRFPSSPQALCDAALFVRACNRTGGKLAFQRKGRTIQRLTCLLPRGVKRLVSVYGDGERAPSLSSSIEERARNISPVPRLFS